LRRVHRLPLVALLAVLLAVLGLAGSAGGGVPAPPPPGDMLPAWSPDGSVIVFLSDRDGLSLRVMNPDGSDDHRIPWLPANSSYSFSPDWSHVAAHVDGQLVVERLDGSDRRSVGAAAYLAKPSWSPDGTRVTFMAPGAISNQLDVVVASIDGSDTHRIAAGVQPAWAPTGERIAYLAGGYGSYELHLANADGSGDVRLTSGGGYSQPSWSPDGTRLAVVHVEPREDGSTLEIVGDNGARLGEFHVTPTDYAWSPRGDEIAYSSGTGVWIVDVASGRKRRLAHFGYLVAWSPDARQLAFTAGGECRNRTGIYRVDVTTRRLLRLTNDCRILGTAGDDVLTGTPLADVLLGEAGNDTLAAVASYFVGDTLVGGPGNDLLVGSFASDTLDGGRGNDVLRGGPGPDLLIGGAGRDVIRGRGGRDLIRARDGRRDVVSCGTNAGRTTGPEGDVAYVDRTDVVSRDCEWVYRPGPAPPVHGRIALTIRVWPQGNQGPKSPRRVYTLRCRPAGGTLPHAASACAKLVRVQNPFAPTAPVERCVLVYGGAQTAGVRGLYGGRVVHVGFERYTSCGVRRWDRLAFLFPVRTSAPG
jgi:Tol biopolymer transport system component